MIRIHPHESIVNSLRAKLERSTKDIATLREKIAQYQEEHPIKSPCTSCRPSTITITPTNLKKDSDNCGRVTLLGNSIECETYRCTISIADGALDNIIAVLINGEYAYRTPISVGASTPIYQKQYYIEKSATDDAADGEGRSLYTITVGATSVMLSNTEHSSTSIRPERIDIIFCSCQGEVDYTIVTGGQESVSVLLG